MTELELLQKLREAVEEETPDCLDKILEKCSALQTDAAAEDPHRKKRHILVPLFAAAAILAFALLGVGQHRLAAPAGRVVFDVNPSIAMTVNDVGTVLGVEALNDDGEGLPVQDLSGLPETGAVESLVEAMLESGCLSSEQNTILASVKTGETLDAEQLRAKIAGAVKTAAGAHGFAPAVLSQVLEEDAELEALAERLGISEGRAKLIQSICTQVEELEPEELTGLPVNALNVLAESNDVNLGSIRAEGEASTEGYVSRERAIAVAMERFGLSEEELGAVDLRFTVVNGALVVEVTVKDGENTRVCCVDAETEAVHMPGEPAPEQPKPVRLKPVSPPKPQPKPSPQPKPQPQPHVHSGRLVAGTPPTETEPGVKDYYLCSCGRAFEDAACTREIADLESWKVIPATGQPDPPPQYISRNAAWEIALRALELRPAEVLVSQIYLNEADAEQPVYHVWVTTWYNDRPSYEVLVDARSGEVLEILTRGSAA